MNRLSNFLRNRLTMARAKNAGRRGGFTLVEILVAVLIVVILITMAVPMYEKTIEKSRIAEVRTILKKVLESKLRVMDNLELDNFGGQFGFNNLDVDVLGMKNGITLSSPEFNYTLQPTTYLNGVCAKRTRGENAGVSFLFLGETATQYCSCPASGLSVCGLFCTEGTRFFCGGAAAACDNYSMDAASTAPFC